MRFAQTFKIATVVLFFLGTLSITPPGISAFGGDGFRGGTFHGGFHHGFHGGFRHGFHGHHGGFPFWAWGLAYPYYAYGPYYGGYYGYPYYGYSYYPRYRYSYSSYSRPAVIERQPPAPASKKDRN